MNRIYRTLYNHSLGLWQVTAETAKARGKSGGGKAAFPRLSLPPALACRLAVSALALAISLASVGARADVTANGDVLPDDVPVADPWALASDMTVGNHSDGSLDITNGGEVSNWTGIIGYDPGVDGTVNVTGGSSWENSENLWVGAFGTGTLNVEGGSTVSNGEGYIGHSSGSEGTVTVTGSSSWENSGGLRVGVGLSGVSVGTLNIENSGKVNNTVGYIGAYGDSDGTVTVTGAESTWTNTDDLYVGLEGTGTLNIESDGTVKSVRGRIGYNSGSEGTVTVKGGGSWENTGDLATGYDSTGTLNIESGGTVSNTVGYLGQNSGSNGTVTVTGAESTWENADDLYVGLDGTGTLNIENGGTVTNRFGRLGYSSGSVGTATVTGGSTWENDGTLHVGYEGTGTLNIGAYGLSDTAGTVTATALTTGSGAGTVNFNQTNDISFAIPIEGNISLEQRGTGVTRLTGTNTYTDGTTISNGTLAVSDGGSISHGAAQMKVGTVAGQTGTLEIGAGSSVISYRSHIGNGGTGSVRVSGSSAQWQVTEQLYTGVNSQGSLDIRNGGTVDVASNLVVGNNSGVAGTVTVDGAGTSLQAGGLILGGNGSGSLALQNGGTATIDGGNGAVVMGEFSGSSGILNFGADDLGAATTAGSLEADRIETDGFDPDVTGTLNFNQTDMLTLAADIVEGIGTISVNQRGTGTTMLTGTNAYTGDTAISDGTLLVNGAIGNNSEVIVTGGALGGNGTVGDVTVNNGGALSAGNSPGTLTVAGNLSLNTGAVSLFELDTPNVAGAGTNDLIVVNGDLSLGGELNIVPLADFDEGDYTLFTYAGAQSGQFGNLDGLSVAWDYALDYGTGSNDAVTLGITAAEAQYWDGANVTANDSVDGGSAIWDTTTGNWTSTSGNTNKAWDGSLAAIFSGTGGTVTIADGYTAEAPALSFLSDGYEIAADGSGSLQLTDSGSVEVLADNATIAAPISGSAGLDKTGAGTLILTGANTYTGGTTVSAGSLQGNTGSLQGDILNNAALVFDQGMDGTYADSISGSGVLTKSGAGNLTLGGANTYTGGTTVSAGTLTGDTTSLQGDILNNAALTFDQTTDGTFANIISGSGSLTKDGAATLTLTGTNTYTGATTVIDGMLVVDGSIVSPLTLESGAMIGGSGTLGDLTVASGATLAPGNSIGTLNIAGDWTLASGATYEVELIGGGNTAGTHNDLVDVGGTATIEDSALLHVTPENGTDDGATNYADGATYTIVQTAGGLTVSGEQDLSDDYAYLDFSTSYDDDNYYLTSSLTTEPDPEPEPAPEPQPIQSFCLAGMSGNQCSTGTAAFSLSAGNDIYDQVLNMSESQAREALTALSGEVHAGSRALLVQQSDQLRRATLNRLHQQEGDGDSAWLELLGDQTRLDGDIYTARVEADDSGVLVGADTELDNDWRLGFFSGYSRSQFDLKQQGATGNADNLHLGMYGARSWDALSVNLGLGYSWSGLETERYTLGQQLNADYDANTLQAFGEVAYRINVGDHWLQPFAALAGVEQRRDNFREDGGSAALDVAGGKMSTGITTLGLRGGTQLMLGDMPVGLYASAGWRHAFNDITPSSRQRFANGSNLSFSVDGASLARNSAQMETGVQMELSDTASVSVNYRGEFSSDSDEQSVSAQFNIAF